MKKVKKRVGKFIKVGKLERRKMAKTTIWDKIYKDYENGGEAWATLSEGIHPLFKKFLAQSNFKLKRVLDIGCGTGKYLKILQAGGFKTEGIDSSETAVKMAKKLLGDEGVILCRDMFEFPIPKNKYGLIISISVIHHGTKKQVKALVNKIYRALATDGKVFITLPDLSSSKKWNTFKEHKEVSEGTFIPLSGPEKGLPHSFYTKEEVKKLFSKFREVKLKLDSRRRWVVRGRLVIQASK